MSSDDHINELLVRWHQHWLAGEDIPAEQLCADWPELLDEVRRAVQKLKRAKPVGASLADTISDGSTPPKPSAVEEEAGLRFRILRPHDEGGQGDVFIARDEELDREVALKEIKPDFVHDEQYRGRFILEAKITGGLEHPGIVPVYSLGRHVDGRPFYAMRFIKGETLNHALRRFHDADQQLRDPSERSLAFRGLLRRFLDVCNAVAYAHSRGVIHRDLKPGNIMLGRYGETLLVDWGLAKVGVRAPEGTVSAANETTLSLPATSSQVGPGTAAPWARRRS
jgi:serine/threonine protein kinase